VIDESSSFKNRAAKRWKAAKAMAIATPRVLLLTGTPAPNGLEDLWAQIYLLDQGERLGRTITAFRQRWFHPGAHNGMVVFEYLPNKGAEEQIYKSISDVAISIRAKDVLKMPERIDERIELALPSGIKEISRRLERDYLCEVGKETLTAASAGVVVNKLLQVADGAVYVERPIHTTALVSRDHDCEKIRVDTGGSDSEPWMEIHRLKLEALERIVEDNEGQSILVYYNYRFDRERILKALSDYGPRTLDGPKDVTDWNLGKIKILLANPASSAFGINLQGGGHIIVWITPIWNLELTQQANARLLRQGQEHPVVIYHIVAKGTEDEEVEKALERKAVTQDDLIKAVRARIREAGGNGNA
jgi:SNF2 family DNA or RNA helicase